MGHRRHAAPLPWIALSLLMLAPPAFAYLDPSTGSMVLSAIVGMFATAALAVKTYWYRIKALFRRRDPNRDQDPDKQRENDTAPRKAPPSAD